MIVESTTEIKALVVVNIKKIDIKYTLLNILIFSLLLSLFEINLSIRMNTHQSSSSEAFGPPGGGVGFIMFWNH